MNRKGENSFNLEEEKAKYGVGMEVYLKEKTGTIIFMNDHYITIKFNDGIKESFVWHELFDKFNAILLTPEEQEVAAEEAEILEAAEKAEKDRLKEEATKEKEEAASEKKEQEENTNQSE